MREERAVIKEISKNSTISGPELSAFVLKSFNKEVSAETCRRISRKKDFNGRGKSLLLIRRTVRNFYNSQKNMLTKILTFGNTSYFQMRVSLTCLIQMDVWLVRWTMVWRKQNTEFKLKNLKGTVKHGGDFVMVWVPMALVI